MKAHLAQLQQLCRVTAELAKNIESTNRLFHKIAHGTTSLFKGSKALVCLANRNAHQYAACGLSQKFINKFCHLFYETCPCYLLCGKKRPFYVSTFSREKESIRRKIQTLIKEEGMGTMLGIPIKSSGENIGCISLFFNGHFVPEHFYLKVLEMFAYEAALTIKNTQLYEKVKESEQLYKELYDQPPCMYYSLKEEGVIFNCNNVGARCLGYGKEELLGRSFFEFLDEGSAPQFRAILDGALKRGLSEGELSFITKDGNNLHTTAKATLASFAGRRDIRVFLTDITEQKKLYEKFCQAEKLTVAGQLIAGIAHDFNNFLTIIRGNVHLMEENGLKNKELKECLNIIKKATLDGAETVRRIREFINVRTVSAKFVSLNLNHILKEVIGYTKIRWKTLAQVKGATYHVKFAKAIRGGFVKGNPSELKEVFLNIINNALDAMPEGGNLIIKTYREDNGLVVSIKDTGVGMSEEVRKRVFDPFFTTKGEEGSGLGMSVAYGIITRHQGEIKIESQEGNGTTVLVKLPFNQAH